MAAWDKVRIQNILERHGWRVGDGYEMAPPEGFWERRKIKTFHVYDALQMHDLLYGTDLESDEDGD